jgi:hypothetical protein
MPEQYPLRGVAFGQRWVSTPACRAARAVAEAPLDPVHYLTLYLMTDPVEETLEEFLDLGRRLRRLGRFHEHRRSHLAGPFRLDDALAAPRVLVSREAVPYRPNCGVYVAVEAPAAPDRLGAYVRRQREEQLPELVAQPGVAGVWTFAGAPDLGPRVWRPGNHRITVCYLDRSPLEVAAALGRVFAAGWRDAPVRPLLAGPFESITPWRWGWFDDAAASGGGPPPGS